MLESYKIQAMIYRTWCLFSVKKPWTELETAAVARWFTRHIQLGKLPKKHEVVTVLSKEPALQRRTWKNVKDYVRNQIDRNASKYCVTLAGFPVPNKYYFD